MRNQRILLNAMVMLAVLFLTGCSDEAMVDYGKPAAQFNEEDVLAKAKPFLGKKITVKGVVTNLDLSDPENPMVYLGHGIACNFGRLKRMAENCKLGSTVFVGGILKRCEEGDILLSPALKRDPKAEFNPMQ